MSAEEKEDPKNKELLDFIMYPFKKTALSDRMYEGAFCWHWHNGWKAKIEEGSKWEILEAKNNLQLEKFVIVKC